VSKRTPHEAAVAWWRRVEGGCGGRAEAVGNGVSSRSRGDISGVCHCKRRGTDYGSKRGFVCLLRWALSLSKGVKSLVAVTEGPTCGISMAGLLVL
jgi:hypothetical protein